MPRQTPSLAQLREIERLKQLGKWPPPKPSKQAPKGKRPKPSGRPPTVIPEWRAHNIARAYARGLSRAEVSRAVFVSEYLLVIWEKDPANQALVESAKLLWKQLLKQFNEEPLV